ncbi:class A beta-lactamase [Streptomyces sp. TRM 70361]|uniref:class A beta-lactamase n=1 Tax=Streptomyces sp. TRM 70361 TaxID=3116553 RepID=UPI002E7BE955|nr:class A beta-lactamase [Streptomyces sp. TRM 70361]MEE1939855.1 class A beta-lactamase [Streptomyces sp. TRM 70361]
MDSRPVRPTRRAVFTLGAAAVLAACSPAKGNETERPPASPSRPPRPPERSVTGRLHALERAHSARLGVFALNPATGTTVLHRADERFAICSVWKPLAVAAVLRDRDEAFLGRRVRYTEADLVAHSPDTGRPENLTKGMTVAELCEATVCRSDNTAGNLLLRELGGPQAVTRFCRSIGDQVTRLDRWETELNSAEPGRVTDTTSPRAVAQTYRRLITGGALDELDRRRLTGWLRENETNGRSFGAGLPADWTSADKTGAGRYGSNNDVGVAWTPDGKPVVLAVLTAKEEETAEPDYPLVAETAELLAREIG